MTNQPPPNREILKQFPQIKNLELFKSGGFKVVYRAEIGETTEAFKIVELPVVGEDDERKAFKKEAVGRIRREIEALGKCNIRELVRLGSIGFTECSFGGTDYVAYSEEFLDGPDLWTLIRRLDALPGESELKNLFSCLIRTIKELWKFGYIHRDIKPLNVIKLSDSARPFVLLDLGIAYCVRETAITYNPDLRLPPATYRYMAPEMAFPNFRSTLDYRSDLYSAALTVYEYGAKKHPLARNAEDEIQTIRRAVNDPPIPLKQQRTDISDSFCQLIDQMLKKKPALRPSDLESLISLMGGTA